MAVLEALRAGPAVVEAEWPEFVDRVVRLVDAGHIRLDVLGQAALMEFDVDVRHQFRTLDQEVRRAAA